MVQCSEDGHLKVLVLFCMMCIAVIFFLFVRLEVHYF